MARVRAAAAAPRVRVRGATGSGPSRRVLPEPGGDGAPRGRRRRPAARATGRALGVSVAHAQSLRARARAGGGVAVSIDAMARRDAHWKPLARGSPHSAMHCVLHRILYLVAVKLHARDPMNVVLGFASSWPTLVLLTRPFSNTCETIVLALCFAVLLLSDPHKRVLCGTFHKQSLFLGSLLAFGVFTRFTFVFFFFPLGIELVRQQDALLCERLAKKQEQKHVSMHLRFGVALNIAVQGLLAFVVWSAGIILLDTAYFHPEIDWRQIDRVRLLETIVIAPLNNFLYNLQYDNLQLHGVHPRLTHATVNMPMLFGPLYIGFIIHLMSRIKALVFSDSATKPKPVIQRGHQLFGIAAVLFPLACISMAPHQEPRFLLPLLVPLHVYFASSLPLWRHRVHAVVWIVFNAALMVFFGILHQGGVVPLLLWFSNKGQFTQSSLSVPLNALSSCRFTTPEAKAAQVQALMGAIPLVFYKTYMPPRFLLANIGGGHATPTFQVIDLAGGSSDNTVETLFKRQLPAAETQRFFLVAPASVHIAPLVENAFVRKSALVGSCGPHLSTEDLALEAPFALHLHLVTLKEVKDRA
ncbi:Gpi mannosyltransferase 4, partial [Globisporangium splendens]